MAILLCEISLNKDTLEHRQREIEGEKERQQQE